MDAARVEGRGAWMAFSMEGMDARKRKPRSGKRPGSPAPAQARRRLRRRVKFEGGRVSSSGGPRFLANHASEFAPFVPASTTMERMVALVDNSPLPSKTALRARGATSPSEPRRATALKSRNCTEFRRFSYGACRRLESCSKDPIGYDSEETSLFVYVSSAPTVLLDPSGQLEIVVTGRGHTAGGCGSTVSRNWFFTLRGKKICEEGYLIQKVTVTCKQQECDACNGVCGKEISGGTFSYFEAWYVKGTTVQHKRSHTDRANMDPPRQSCGSYTQTGEIRFYCIADTGNLGKLDTPGDWDIGTKFGEDAGCGTGAGGLPSTDDPAKTKFWKENPENGVASATRDFSVNWNCCDRTEVNDEFHP
jgi:hypothetical protein